MLANQAYVMWLLFSVFLWLLLEIMMITTVHDIMIFETEDSGSLWTLHVLNHNRMHQSHAALNAGEYRLNIAHPHTYNSDWPSVATHTNAILCPERG